MLSFWKRKLYAHEIAKVLEIKKFWRPEIDLAMVESFPFNFGNSIFTHTKVESRAFCGS
jgi:hypothetical protein